jgi:DNA-binding transcriptional LysR family regulator
MSELTAREPGWELYRTFLEVLREGSLSAAARSLGSTQPTVGRHIDALEAALGQSLFVRTQRGFSATEAAEALRPYAESLAATSAALLRVASDRGGGVQGAVRITASDVIAVEVLPPILAELQARHRQLAVELVPSNRIEDLLHRASDIAVRMLRPTQGALVARHIGRIEIGLYAHRAYLDARGTPASLDELDGHTLIGFDRETAFTRALTRQYPWIDRQRLSLRTDSDVAAIAALRAGCGIGACQVGIARRHPELVRLFAEQFVMELDTWLAMHEGLRDVPRCRVAFAALADGLARYVDGTL